MYAFLLATGVSAQIPTFNFAKSTVSGVANAYEGMAAIATDNAGNIYSTGDFNGTTDFDPGPGTVNMISNSGTADVYITKHDPNGNLLWARQLGGTFADYPSKLMLTASGEVVVCGTFGSTVDFDPGAGTFNMTSSGMSDVFVLKLNTNGGFVWAKKIGGTDTDNISGLATDNAGNLFLGGYFKGVCDFDPGAAVSNYTATGSATHAYVTKLDASGNFLWNRQMGGTGTSINQSYDLVTDASGDIYSTGWYNGSCDFDPGSGTDNYVVGGLQTAYVHKLLANGNYAYTRFFTSSTLNATLGYDLATDALNNVLVTGTHAGVVDLDPGAAAITYTSNGLTDVFIVKLASAGTFMWGNSIGGLGYDYVGRVYTDVSNNILVCGNFQSPVMDFDPGAGTYTLSATSTDGYLLKLDPAGNFSYALPITGPSVETISDVVVRGTDVMFGGTYNSAGADFDPGVTTFTMSASNNAFDAFWVKLGVCTPPVAPVNTTSLSVACANQSLTLSASGTGTIQWYATNTATNSIAAGPQFTTPLMVTPGTFTYYASVTTCTASPRTPITLTINALPVLNPVSSASLICTGSSASLSVSGASSYSWTNAGTGSVIVVSPTVTTVYTVSGTDGNGCKNTGSITQNVSNCTFMNEMQEGETLIRLFPNPANDVITLQVNGSFEWLISNTLGEVVERSQGTDGVVLDLKSLTNGIYHVTVVKDNKRTVSRFVKY